MTNEGFRKSARPEATRRSTSAAFQRCIHPDCAAEFELGDVRFACRYCGSLLDVAYAWDRCEVPKSLHFFDARRTSAGCSPNERADFSGVWRFRELMPFAAVEELVTVGEGRTHLQQADGLARYMGQKPGTLFLQYEGLNPSGSFKDNGMAAAFTMARRLGRKRVACASTGNTSASLAMYASLTRLPNDEPMEAVVFVGGDRIALGKLAQALDYGAKTLQLEGDFDACMKLVQEAAQRLELYLMNSVNPFRLEGQKSIMFRILEGLNWEVPDWIIVPGGNLGNCSAFGKAFLELKELGLVLQLPRLAVINASGANTLHVLVNERGLRWNGGRIDDTLIKTYYQELSTRKQVARTIASAIEIARPVNLPKALRSLEAMEGVVRQVSDEAILEGKALAARHGLGCEPASGASIAGLKLMREEQLIAPSDRVVCILTGHALKDPDVTMSYHLGDDSQRHPRQLANPPIQVQGNLDSIIESLIGRMPGHPIGSLKY